MKPKTDSLRAAGFFLFLLMPCLLILVSCGDWVVPKTLVGMWSATQKVTVR